MTELRRKLLAATLPHVPFDGWTDAALRAGARDAGVEPVTARRAFPRGADDVIAFWSVETDRRMTEELERRDLEVMRVRDRVATTVRVRLELLAEHREALRLALSRAVLPRHGFESLRALYRTVDAMWRAAGDTATDFNFYTKRALLAGVYTSTLLYWLEDDSEGFAATWVFLERRIADVMRIPRAVGRISDYVPDLGRLLGTARARRGARG